MKKLMGWGTSAPWHILHTGLDTSEGGRNESPEYHLFLQMLLHFLLTLKVEMFNYKYHLKNTPFLDINFKSRFKKRLYKFPKVLSN